MIDLGKQHRSGLILALLGSLFFFAFTANAFGDLEEYFVGDFVWFDTDCDGIQDHDEPGVPDVLVSALDCNGNSIGETTVTNANGFYWLSLGKYHGAPPDFKLCFVLPDDLECDFTSPKGDKGSKDSDVNIYGCTDCIHWEGHWGTECDRWDAGVCCEPCGECKGKVIELTLQYTGDSEATIKVVQKKDNVVVDTLSVEPDDVFIIFGQDSDGTFGTEISIFVNDNLHTKIHTSCSQPIGPGLIFGDFLIIEGFSMDGGLLCPEEPSDDCGCKGKVTRLTLKYLGDPETIQDIFVVQKKGTFATVEEEEDLIDGKLAFTIYGKDKNGTLGTEISIFVNDNLHTKIHTSCSQPIGPGLIFGDFEVVSGQSLKGGLLCPVPPGDDDCECKGKVTDLTLSYDGGGNPFIEVFQKKVGTLVYAEFASTANPFTVFGQDKNGTLGTEILVYVDDVLNTKIHTSCSKPIGPGLVSGAFTVVEGHSLKGGALCPVDDDDGKKGGKKGHKGHKGHKKGGKKGK